MDPLMQLVNALPAVVVGIVLAFYLRGRFEDVDRRFDEQKADTNRQFDEIRRQIDRLSSELAATRSDLTNVALAVGARLRPETGTG